MFIERAIESILIFICLAFQERVPHYLAATYPNLKDYESWIFIGWWVLLIAIYLGLVALLKTVLRSFPAWSGRYHQGVLQGAWLQHIGNERPWGVAYIKYDWRADQWIYAGVGFDDAMSLAAEWQTYGQQVTKNITKFTWHLAGEGTLLDVKAGIVREISKFDITVLLKFSDNVKKFGVTGKAADLNFHSTASDARNQDDLIFSLELTHLDRPESIVQEVRRMTTTQREQLFAPIRRLAAMPARGS
jgi:hypothetical protein